MLKKDFDQQRTKAIAFIEGRYAYWKPGKDLFDKPKGRLIEFYQVWKSVKEETDVHMGRISKSMVPDGLGIVVMISYSDSWTYMAEVGEQVEIYNVLHKDPEIKRR